MPSGNATVNESPEARAEQRVIGLETEETTLGDLIKVLEMHEDNPDSRSADEWKAQLNN